MKPTPFEYHRPESVTEAVNLLAENERAVLMAGNQTLGVDMSYRSLEPDHVVDVGELELSHVTAEDGSIEVGATTLHREIEASELLETRLQMLAEAAAAVAGPSVRSVGTFGGSVGKAHPASNYLTVLRAMDASLSVRSAGGRSTIDVETYLEEGIERDELIESATIQVEDFPAARSGSAFLQLKHAKLTWPTINSSAIVRLEDDVVTDARVSLANAAPHHIRLPEAEAAVEDTDLSESALEAAAAAAVEAAEPVPELHADDDFKLEMAGEYARRALSQAYERADGGE
jgi:carbon-monoxide dehydrogenase medium subunit